MIVINETIKLVKEECCVCAMVFAMPLDFYNRCRDKGPDKSFFCPNGHSQSYRNSRLKQEIDRLADENQQLQQSRFSLQNQLTEKEMALKKLNNSIKLKDKRLKAGVCPCCNRTFKQLANHMKSKHPEFSK